MFELTVGPRSLQAMPNNLAPSSRINIRRLTIDPLVVDNFPIIEMDLHEAAHDVRDARCTNQSESKTKIDG